MNKTCYAIGDIHGMLGKLKRLLAEIAKKQGKEPYSIVFLGDYVDRGKESAEVVSLVKSICEADPENRKALLGNHEDMMLRAIAGQGNWYRSWHMNGGVTTENSYERQPNGKELLHEHVKWMIELPICIESDHHVFVHGAIQPGVDMKDQARDVMLWDRGWEGQYEDLMELDLDNPPAAPKYCLDELEQLPGKHVIYGHTPRPGFKPKLMKWSSGLDTGSCFPPSGQLTAGKFDLSKPGPALEVISV